MGGRGPDGTHLVESHVCAADGRLPGRFGARKPSTDYRDRGFHKFLNAGEQRIVALSWRRGKKRRGDAETRGGGRGGGEGAARREGARARRGDAEILSGRRASPPSRPRLFPPPPSLLSASPRLRVTARSLNSHARRYRLGQPLCTSKIS